MNTYPRRTIALGLASLGVAALAPSALARALAQPQPRSAGSLFFYRYGGRSALATWESGGYHTTVLASEYHVSQTGDLYCKDDWVLVVVRHQADLWFGTATGIEFKVGNYVRIDKLADNDIETGATVPGQCGSSTSSASLPATEGRHARQRRQRRRGNSTNRGQESAAYLEATGIELVHNLDQSKNFAVDLSVLWSATGEMETNSKRFGGVVDGLTASVRGAHRPASATGTATESSGASGYPGFADVETTQGALMDANIGLVTVD
jgi:hypothetical protein